MLPTDYLERLKDSYPSRDGDNGWLYVRTAIPRALSAGSTWERIQKGTLAYRAHCDRKGLTGTDKVKQARTFYGPDQWFEEWADMEPVIDARAAALQARWAALHRRRLAIHFRPPSEMETVDSFETTLRQAEREHGNGSYGDPTARSVPEMRQVVSILAHSKKIA